jgi:hypothetical protein
VKVFLLVFGKSKKTGEESRKGHVSGALELQSASGSVDNREVAKIACVVASVA